MFDQPFNVFEPESRRSCAIFNTAHSGSGFPDAFLSDVGLSIMELRTSEDAFVDQLIADAPSFGAPLLAANFSRAYVDANRSATELDPALIRGLTRQKTTPRLSAGLGVLPRVVAEGKVIHRGKISLQAAQDRLEQCYFPYHSALTNLIASQQQLFGICLLIDVHSMPCDAVKNGNATMGNTPDIILGDRFGLSCDHWLTSAVSSAFVNAGLSVTRNTPFAGGYITQHYGQPKKNIHAIQIEINRALYMDEKRIEPLPVFEDFRRLMNGILQTIAKIGPSEIKFAAE